MRSTSEQCCVRVLLQTNVCGGLHTGGVFYGRSSSSLLKLRVSLVCLPFRSYESISFIESGSRPFVRLSVCLTRRLPNSTASLETARPRWHAVPLWLTLRRLLPLRAMQARRAASRRWGVRLPSLAHASAPPRRRPMSRMPTAPALRVLLSVLPYVETKACIGRTEPLTGSIGQRWPKLGAASRVIWR